MLTRVQKLGNSQPVTNTHRKIPFRVALPKETAVTGFVMVEPSPRRRPIFVAAHGEGRPAAAELSCWRSDLPRHLRDSGRRGGME